MSSVTPMTLTTYDIPPNRPEVSIANEASELFRFAVPAHSARSAIKRTIDVIGSACGLLMLVPFLVLIGVLIRLDSKGPSLFRQKRVGFRGREFVCFKFRTMVPDAEARLRDLEARNESAGGVLFKIKDDPRITPLGRFLRRTSLDEFPQLWNVLRGEMSLVGPRPLQLRDSEKLEKLDPKGYGRRLTVLPGVTGPWQVGGRSEVDSDRMLQLDLGYVENWSIAADLGILVKTVAVVLAGRGAC
jgi:lipopolysaccharide/colanic/teichoic acid biosynthesis glycosyltransferase